MAAAMEVLLPSLLDGRATFKLINHGSKSNLLTRLPNRLHGYTNWHGDWRVLVLVDRDQDDCLALKRRLEAAAATANLPTKSNPDPVGRFRVVNRIVVEELEAWFFGDPDALRRAYPRLSMTALNKAPFRAPDRIVEGTWEALLRTLQGAGYYRGTSSLPKIALARAVAAAMNPDCNHSPSFQAFRQGLNALLA